MALDLGTETVAIKERTFKVEILTGVGEDPTVIVHREKVWLKDNVIIRREEVDRAIRTLSQVSSQDFGGMTGLQLAGAIALAGDTFRKEDAK